MLELRFHHIEATHWTIYRVLIQQDQQDGRIRALEDRVLPSDARRQRTVDVFDARHGKERSGVVICLQWDGYDLPLVDPDDFGLDDAILIASELITNAVVATPGKEIRYQCSRDAHGVLIAVWDGSPTRPRVRPQIDMTLNTLDVSEDHWDDNGGRGLPIIAALATKCGHTPDPTGGKWVWATLKT